MHFVFLNFRPFPVKTKGVEHILWIWATFFSSACKIAQVKNRPKISLFLFFRHFRDWNILGPNVGPKNCQGQAGPGFAKKTFGTCVTNIRKNKSPWRGPKPYFHYRVQKDPPDTPHFYPLSPIARRPFIVLGRWVGDGRAMEFSGGRWLGYQQQIKLISKL